MTEIFQVEEITYSYL